jgi:hypothetical protein
MITIYCDIFEMFFRFCVKIGETICRSLDLFFGLPVLDFVWVTRRQMRRHKRTTKDIDKCSGNCVGKFAVNVLNSEGKGKTCFKH